MTTQEVVDESPLATAVKQRREDLGLTIVDASQRARLSRSSWHEIESGRRRSTFGDTLERIDEALELNRGTLRRIVREANANARATHPCDIVYKGSDGSLTTVEVKQVGYMPLAAGDAARQHLAKLIRLLPDEDIDDLVGRALELLSARLLPKQRD